MFFLSTLPCFPSGYVSYIYRIMLTKIKIQTSPVLPQKTMEKLNTMHRTGVANLPLHYGKAPAWLTVRMRKLAKEIANIMIEEHGTATFIQRLSDPSILWKTLVEYASPGTKIFVYDLVRPYSEEEAMRLVNLYLGNEPAILKKDFYHSLLAAFEPEEVEQRLTVASLPELTLKVVSDRHMIVSGTKT